MAEANPPVPLTLEAAYAAGVDLSADAFTWPMSEAAYGRPARALLNRMLALTRSRELSQPARDALAMKLPAIYLQIGRLFTILQDIAAARAEGRDVLPGRPPVYQHAVAGTLDACPLPIDQGRARDWRRRVVRTAQGMLAALERRPVLVYGSNKLRLQEIPTGKHRSVRWLVSDRASLPTGFAPDAAAEALGEQVAATALAVAREHDVPVGADAAPFIHRLAATHCGHALYDMRDAPAVLPGLGRAHLHGHAGTRYPGRLVAYLYWRAGSPVTRYLHGPDRAFFDDANWPMTELAFCDTAVAHGALEAARAQKRVELDYVPGPPTPMPTMVARGSQYHRGLVERFLDRPDRPQKAVTGPNVLYVLGSLVEPERHLPNMKQPDVPYLSGARRLVRQLLATGHHVTVKRHPKGFYKDWSLFPGFQVAESTGDLIEAIAAHDTVVFDMAGSAFVEALCTDRHVVLVNFPQRLIDPHSFAYLEASCCFMQAGASDGNLLTIATTDLREALCQPSDLAERQAAMAELLLTPTS